MTIQAQAILILWFPFVIFLFWAMPARKAIAIAFLGSFLLLPSRTGFLFPLLPDYAKLSSTTYAVIVGILIFDLKTILRYRPHWIDIPIFIYAISPMFSSLSNGLGAYDGLNNCLSEIFRWVFPYLIGRIYFSSFSALKEFAILIVKAGIIYIPLCLWEIRMSPHLHTYLYGFFAHPSGLMQQIRGFGLWRPMVFTGHGLIASLFMLFAGFLALWLWQSKAIDKIWSIKISVWTYALLATTVLTQSKGVWVYLLVLTLIFVCARYLKSNFVYAMILSLMLYYMFAMTSGAFNGEAIVNWIGANFSPERAQSLQYRWSNEIEMAAKARIQPLFGWGGWGRNRIYAYDWKGEIVDTSTTDSIAILQLGTKGFVGYLSFYSSILLPSILYCFKKYPVRTWFNSKTGIGAAFSIFSLIFVMDTLLNAPVQPPLMIAAGAITGIVAAPVVDARTSGNLGGRHRKKTISSIS